MCASSTSFSGRRSTPPMAPPGPVAQRRRHVEQVVDPHIGMRRQQRQATHQVLELAEVARPGVRLKHPHGGREDVHHAGVPTLALPGQEQVDERGDVFATLP